jgi:RNA polymerase sigma-70 factor (ECF subfamily)
MTDAASTASACNSPERTHRVALVRRAQAGDSAAFAQLAQSMGRAIYAIALAHMGRAADAEDVAQTVLLAALENIENCRDPERFEPWIFAIARNRSRRALLRRVFRDVLARPPAEHEHDEATTHLEAASDPASTRVDKRALLAALAVLPARQREVVLLHDLEEYTHPEVAAALEITEEASRQLLSRAHRQLRELLAKDHR